MLFPGAQRLLRRPPVTLFLILCRPHAGRHFCIFSASVIYQSGPDSRVFCTIDISAQGRNFLLSSLLMYTTLFQQILPRLQNSCNSGQSSPVASQFSMQIVEVYKLHSFSVQVYSLWQWRQNRAKNKRNICTFSAAITTICIFLFFLAFGIIFVYNGCFAEASVQEDVFYIGGERK